MSNSHLIAPFGIEPDDARQMQEDADADSDREAYRAALSTALAELNRLDAAMKGKPATMITSSMRIRRVRLCTAIAGLKELAASLGTH